MRAVITLMQKEIVRLLELSQKAKDARLIELHVDLTATITEMHEAIAHIRAAKEIKGNPEEELKNTEFLFQAIDQWVNEKYRPTTFKVQRETIKEAAYRLNQQFKITRR